MARYYHHADIPFGGDDEDLPQALDIALRRHASSSAAATASSSGSGAHTDGTARPPLRFGDVVRVGDSDYRNVGIGIYDGDRLIDLDYDRDGYGALPPQFTVWGSGAEPGGATWREANHWSAVIPHNSCVWLNPARVPGRWRPSKIDAPPGWKPTKPWGSPISLLHSSFEHGGVTHTLVVEPYESGTALAELDEAPNVGERPAPPVVPLSLRREKNLFDRLLALDCALPCAWIADDCDLGDRDPRPPDRGRTATIYISERLLNEQALSWIAAFGPRASLLEFSVSARETCVCRTHSVPRSPGTLGVCTASPNRIPLRLDSRTLFGDAHDDAAAQSTAERLGPKALLQYCRDRGALLIYGDVIADRYVYDGSKLIPFLEYTAASGPVRVNPLPIWRKHPLHGSQITPMGWCGLCLLTFEPDEEARRQLCQSVITPLGEHAEASYSRAGEYENGIVSFTCTADELRELLKSSTRIIGDGMCGPCILRLNEEVTRLANQAPA